MSGGSYDYLYAKMQEAADRLSQPHHSPLRRAFAKRLVLFADAMQVIEWVDSCDRSKGEEDEAIERALGSSCSKQVLQVAIDEAQRTLEELTKAIEAATVVKSTSEELDAAFGHTLPRR